MTTIDPIALEAVTGGTLSSTGAGTLLQRPTVAQPQLARPSLSPSFQLPKPSEPKTQPLGPFTPNDAHGREV